MAVLFVSGVLFLACAAALFSRALMISRIRVSSQMRQIEAYGFGAGEDSTGGPASRSPAASLNRIAEKIGRSVQGGGLLAPIDVRLLRAAGMYRIDPATFQGYRVLAATGVPGFLLLESVLAGTTSAMSFLLCLAAAAVCWILPQTMVRTRGQRRMATVDAALPELIDVLTATVEAGLGFAGSLQLVAMRFRGPLGQELRLMLQEQTMGLSTERALSNLLERCDTPSVRAFARAIMQGESLGVSIGAMLRNLARESRNRRRQAAREQIMKAPVKMLFPLVFLILPALLLVMLYPGISHTLHVLGAH